MGPVINSDAYKKYKKYTKIASKKGKILYGGSTIDEGSLRYGYYVKPTVIEDISENNILVKKELFLPMLIVSEYENYDKALEFANKSEYGLTAGIYSNDEKEIEIFLKTIESGVVYVNRQKGATTGAMVGRQSFGGWKKSGTSGKGSGGKYYLTQFMREQSQTFVS
jgi:1-pyrroline-5-carboxylate dehydrogenase